MSSSTDKGQTKNPAALPHNFAEQVSKLEKDLKRSNLTIEGLRDLLVLYKLAKEYNANRNEKLKNEFYSKYIFTLNLPYTKKLLISKVKR